MAAILLICLMILAYGSTIENEQSAQPVSNVAQSTFAKKMTQRLVTIQEVVKVDDADVQCLQANIYFEAGNQSVQGKEAIALVTLNRTKTKHYPNEVCDVVYQRKQFSWANHGKRVPKLKNKLEAKQWAIAKNVAIRALRGEIKDVTMGATHYHATYVNPSWANAKRMKFMVAIGTHIFYKDTFLKTRS